MSRVVHAADTTRTGGAVAACGRVAARIRVSSIPSHVTCKTCREYGYGVTS